MRGEFVYSILRFIEEGLTTFIDLEAAILVSGYGASGKKIDFNFSKIHRQRKSLVDRAFVQEGDRGVKRRLSRMIAYLRKDNLITADRENLSLTPRGKKKFISLSLLMSKNQYKNEATRENTYKIVMFDIPVKKNSQRFWLRAVLRNLGFKMFQKSVWIGKVGIPERFLKDLDRIGILDFVEILEITKTGSIRGLD